MAMSRAERDALDRAVSPARMSTYVRAANGDVDWARGLYLWDRELAVAFLADIALLEVALRNAMNDRLAARWGPEWYARTDLPLDDRTCAQPAQAHAGRAVARADGRRWGRSYAHQVVARVNALRNRVAHHEPLIHGFPLPGQRLADGGARRLTAEEGFDDLVRLAAMLDRELARLLRRTSAVPDVLARRPRARDVRPRPARGATRTPAGPVRRSWRLSRVAGST